MEAISKRKTETEQDLKRLSFGFQKRLNKLLEENLNSLHKDFNALKKGITKCSDFIFTFLTDKNVPFDNNGSERERYET